MFFKSFISLFQCLLFLFDAVSGTIVAYQLNVNTSFIVSNIQYPFYGFSLDFWKSDDPDYGSKWGEAGILELNLSNTNLIELTKALTPAILRIGGSPQDMVVYNISGECNENYGSPGYDCPTMPAGTNYTSYYGCVNKSRWNQIIQFGVETNVTLVFGVNACYGRSKDNLSMNFSNIENLLLYTKNNSLPIFGFELGNEVTSTINDSTYANDYYTFYKLINEIFNDGIDIDIDINSSKGDHDSFGFIPKVLGTDDGRISNSQIVLKYLNTIANENNLSVNDILYRFTYHNYPNCQTNYNNSIWNINCLQSSIQGNAVGYKNMINETLTGDNDNKDLPIWMGEGAGNSGGGNDGVSNTFFDSFYYLFQLCTMINNNIAGTIRADLTGGDYELIDHKTFLPNPDYWMLWLWKQFIGNELYQSVLAPTTTPIIIMQGATGEHNNVASYNGNVATFAFQGKDEGSVVLIVINFDETNEASINVSFNGNNGVYSQSNEYLIRSANGTNINSKFIYVNDVLMKYENSQFPPIKPVQGDGKTVQLDPATIKFVVFE